VERCSVRHGSVSGLVPDLNLSVGFESTELQF